MAMFDLSYRKPLVNTRQAISVLFGIKVYENSPLTLLGHHYQ